MSKNYAIIIQFVLPLMTFCRSGAQKSNVYKRDAFVTSWRFHNRAWQPQRHDRLSETSGTLWIHRGALTNQRCSLATGCGINARTLFYVVPSHYLKQCWPLRTHFSEICIMKQQFSIENWHVHSRKSTVVIKVKVSTSQATEHMWHTPSSWWRHQMDTFSA